MFMGGFFALLAEMDGCKYLGTDSHRQMKRWMSNELTCSLSLALMLNLEHTLLQCDGTIMHLSF